MQSKILLKRGLEFAVQGDLLQAIEIFRQAVEENPADSEAYNCLGAAQYNAHLFEEAENSLNRALGLNPQSPNALCNLGALFISTHRQEAAKICFEQVIQISPTYPEAYNNLGFVLLQEGHFAAADLVLRRAIELRPNYSSAYNNLGLTQAKRLLLAEAEASFRSAIEQQSDFPEAWNNLGLLLKETNRLEEAAKYLYGAIKLNPKFAEAYNNLGSVLTDADHVELAENCFCRAIRLKPDYPDPYHNLGVLFTNTNRLAEAEVHFSQALKLNPNYTEAEFSLATLYLLQGRYQKGWEKYDKSRMIKYSIQPDAPRWNGENLAGKRILLYHEQGLGDTLQFIRYVQPVEKSAAATALWVQKPLQGLLAASFPSLPVYSTETMPPGEFDFSCPLPSLPRVFNTSQRNIPRTIPYINPSAEIAAKWDNIFSQLNRNNLYRVGIAWAGNPNHHNDGNRSIALAVFGALFEVPAVSWISLQVGEQASGLQSSSSNIFDFSDRLANFEETAGVIANLDLVISVDTAVAHLAGAMGKLTWLLLPFAPDWRWQLKREDSPWYPTIRIFRQHKAGDWPDVVVRVKKALTIISENGYR